MTQKPRPGRPRSYLHVWQRGHLRRWLGANEDDGGQPNLHAALTDTLLDALDELDRRDEERRDCLRALEHDVGNEHFEGPDDCAECAHYARTLQRLRQELNRDESTPGAEVVT